MDSSALSMFLVGNSGNCRSHMTVPKCSIYGKLKHVYTLFKHGIFIIRKIPEIAEVTLGCTRTSEKDRVTLCHTGSIGNWRSDTNDCRCTLQRPLSK